MTKPSDHLRGANTRWTGPLWLAMCVTLGLQCSCGDDDGGVCGDAVVDPGEQCDEGPNPFFDPECYCSNACVWLGPACDQECGDGIVTGSEECDGEVIGGGVTCESLGEPAGTLSCSGDCTLDTSSCGADMCGNGTCNPGETFATCPADCPLGTCGDCVCDADIGETAGSCPTDCPHASCVALDPGPGETCAVGETCWDTVCVAGTPACTESWQILIWGGPMTPTWSPTGCSVGQSPCPVGMTASTWIRVSTRRGARQGRGT